MLDTDVSARITGLLPKSAAKNDQVHLNSTAALTHEVNQPRFDVQRYPLCDNS